MRRVEGTDDKERSDTMIKPSAIPIPRASEELIQALIAQGILYVDETGIHVTEK